MFTGIIESLGKVVGLASEEGNLHITVQSALTPELKIDQSVAHNGVCLTVVDKTDDTYTVTAIQETLQKTNLGLWKLNDVINLERAMKLGDRLDGHIVQGHVDATAKCIVAEETDGSWHFRFEYDESVPFFTIEKGSVTVNGVSLTVVNASANAFSVAIIPYTFEHTNFSSIKVGDLVNLEFDVIGKYITQLQLRQSAGWQSK